MLENFKTETIQKYNFQNEGIELGVGMYEKELVNDAIISVPLKTLNRHGLIAGATGTGKTKTLQKLCELLVRNGISVLAMDIKGDLSGLSQVGEMDDRVINRMKEMKLDWQPRSTPVEFFTLTNDLGAKLRATISEFGSVLFSKILDLNEVQSGVVAMIFKYCDDNALPLVDLEDFKKVMLFITNEGKEQIRAEYGQISSATVSTIQRKIIEIETQGAGIFFGEPSFEVFDLINQKVNILTLASIQDKPLLFSTFMLSLLAEIYAKFPEVGDIEKPKLVIFIDEAHLIFENATKQLLDQIETTIKLIRSKGIGIFFITQQPTDIPADVLSQLGMKVQHALRAFTARDRQSIKLVSENYPETKYYDVDNLITELGIGEALFTCLDEYGIPTPLVHMKVAAPESRMDIITENEKADIVKYSPLALKYNQIIDRESAREILERKIGEYAKAKQAEEEAIAMQKSRRRNEDTRPDILGDLAGKFIKNATSSAGRSIGTKIMRGIMGKIFK